MRLPSSSATKRSAPQNAESIRTQGVLSPLLVRPLTDQSFEIVAGARRYRAAQIAEAPTVPVRIVNLTDAEALEAQLVELSIVVKRFLVFVRPRTSFICKRRAGPRIDAPRLGASRGRENLPQTPFSARTGPLKRFGSRRRRPR
jgi:hypothetical protein